VADIKKSMNISTVRATPEEKAKLQELAKKLGFSSMAHFFTRAMETLFEQTDAGDELTWPLRFEAKKRGDHPKEIPPSFKRKPNR
jgi:hypothetical protein